MVAGGVAVVGLNRPRTDDLRGSENLLYDATVEHTFHYGFVRTHNMYNIRSGSRGEPRTWGDNGESVEPPGL